MFLAEFCEPNKRNYTEGDRPTENNSAGQIIFHADPRHEVARNSAAEYVDCE